MKTVVLFFLLFIILFFTVEGICRYQKKSLLEVVHPSWFNDITQFPYEEFPCKVNTEQYYQTVEKGYEKMKQKRVVIAGLCINIEKNIPKLRKRLEQMCSLFKDYQIVIFENDSSDGTRPLLHEWTGENQRVHLLECASADCKLNVKGAVQYGALSTTRMKKMADYRNRLLTYVSDHFSDYDCMIMTDLDISGPTSLNGLAHSFGLYNTWDSVSAMGLNGITLTVSSPIYYDTLAYEDDRYNRKTTNLYDFLCVYFNTRKDIGSGLLPVRSGFGGLAIYKMDILKNGVDYNPVDGDYKCEHKIFHDNMRTRGFSRVFIDPNLVILVGLQGPVKTYPFH